MISANASGSAPRARYSTPRKVHDLLFGLDIGGLDERAAHGEAALDDLAELVRRAGRDRDAEDAELFLHLIGGEDLGDRLVETRDERRRGSCGGKHGMP